MQRNVRYAGVNLYYKISRFMVCAIDLNYAPGLKHNRYRCDIGCIEVVEDFEQFRNHLKSSNYYSMRLNVQMSGINHLTP